MNPTSDLYLFAVPGLGMLLVSVLAVVVWRRASGAEFKWFWAGAGLWAVAVALKVAFALFANRAAAGVLRKVLPRVLFPAGVGVYLGVVSAVFEVGLTCLAGLRWRQLGRDRSRAVAVGVGAGSFEALLLGCVFLGSWLVVTAGGADAAEARGAFLGRAVVTPLFWLAPPAERAIALLGHASTRALVLLGVTGRRPWMVLWGFSAFALVDGTSGFFELSPDLSHRSMWWRERLVLLGVLRADGRGWCAGVRRVRTRGRDQRVLRVVARFVTPVHVVARYRRPPVQPRRRLRSGAPES